MLPAGDTKIQVPTTACLLSTRKLAQALMDTCYQITTVRWKRG